MNYLEVKYDALNNEHEDTNDFVFNVINSQKSLGLKNNQNFFEHDELISLGFKYNPSTKGYAYVQNFTLKELKYLTKEVNKLPNHILSHGYLVLKCHNNELYFWDTALIYEGIDTFEYCLKYHNIFKLGEINIVTKSDNVNEELLNLVNYTKRYNQPTLGFITQDCVWDKKGGLKIQKSFVKNINEYISLNEVIDY